MTIFGGFPDGSVGKESTCKARDEGYEGWIPRSQKSLEKGNGNPLEYSCLGKIPWTEETDKPQSRGSQSIRHD